MDTDHLLEAISDWASARGDVRAVCVVGSHARGEAHPDSDVDLVLLSTEPHALLDDASWRDAFGDLETSDTEDWGALQSVRARYRDGTAIEFGIASLRWAALPLDPGTREVITRGMVAVYDPDGILARLEAALAEESAKDARMGA